MVTGQYREPVTCSSRDTRYRAPVRVRSAIAVGDRLTAIQQLERLIGAVGLRIIRDPIVKCRSFSLLSLLLPLIDCHQYSLEQLLPNPNLLVRQRHLLGLSVPILREKKRRARRAEIDRFRPTRANSQSRGVRTASPADCVPKLFADRYESNRRDLIISTQK